MNEESSSEEKSAHEAVAEAQPRDEHGHFAPKTETQPVNQTTSDLLKTIITPSVSKTTDENTLVDIHVNNPLKKIVELLQDIKKQKAFSFTLKGSLGIMGVALVLSTFGILGGSKMLCDKGIQTEIGTVKQLSAYVDNKSDVPILGGLLDFYNNIFLNQNVLSLKHRVVLIKNDDLTIQLLLPTTYNLQTILDQKVYITGQYDGCSQTLKVSNSSDIQVY